MGVAVRRRACVASGQHAPTEYLPFAGKTGEHTTCRSLARVVSFGLCVCRARNPMEHLSLIGLHQTKRCEELEARLSSLNERFEQALEYNRVVLPSGHEVRWYGRKEHMQAHSPVAAAHPPPAAASNPAARGGIEAAKVVGGGASARGHAAVLRRRLLCAESEAERSRCAPPDNGAKLSSRDDDASLHGTGVSFGRDSSGRSAAQGKMAISLLNHQVRLLPRPPHPGGCLWRALPWAAGRWTRVAGCSAPFSSHSLSPPRPFPRARRLTS